MLTGKKSATDVVQFVQQLAVACQEILKKQDTVVSVQQPVKIFGDIHGQFFDLLSQFRAFGFPSCPDGDVDLVTYIFNGDFVDRGPHQLEVVVLLFALKIV
jgi:hypothetical protein